MLSILLSLTILSQTPDTADPVITWEPLEPGWGDTLTLTYHHDSPEAYFKGTATVMLTYLDQTVPMKRKVNLSRIVITVPDSIAELPVVVHLIEYPDRRSQISIPVDVPEAWRDEKQEFLETLKAWNSLDKKKIRNQLDSLLAQPIDKAYFRSLCMHAYANLGELDSAWTVLENMSKKDKGSYYYAMALHSFQIREFTTDEEIISRYYHYVDEELKGTTQGFLLYSAIPRWSSGNTHLSVKEQEMIIKRLIADDPYDLHLVNHLYEFHLDNGDSLKAEEALTSAINMNIAGEPQKHGKYCMTPFNDLLLSQMMLERGKLRAAQGRYQEALTDFSFVILMEDEYMGEAYLERAKVWMELGRYLRAKGSCIRAMKNGCSQAEPIFSEVYELIKFSDTDYQDYLTLELKPGPGVDFKEVENFGFIDLVGKPGELSDYRGKIIVATFWGRMTCGGTIQMDYLNRLARKYQDKEVVFLGFTFDEPEEMKEFLESNPFEYQTLVIRKSVNPFKIFGLRKITGQAIVDSEGRVRYTLGSAVYSESQLEDMRFTIDQLLREQELEEEN